ncbi:MAG: sugar transferase [Elusimicrobiota bacterium]
MADTLVANKKRLGTNAPARGFPRWLRHVVRTALHFACDGAAVTLAFWLAYRMRFHWDWLTVHFPIVGHDPGWGLYASLLYAVVPIWLGLFWYASRLYTRPWASPFDRFLHIGKGTVLGTLATLVATYIYGRLHYSRLLILAAGPLAAVAVSLAHYLVLRFDAWLAEFEAVSPMLVIGRGKVADLVRKNVHLRHPRVPIHRLHRLPGPRQLLEVAEREGAATVVLVHGGVDHAAVLELAEACESAGIDFRMIPDLLELRLGEIQMDESLGLPAYRIQHTQLTRANFAAKRAFDLAFALAVLVILGIPLLLIGLFIRWDSRGPALFKQKRIGFRGAEFEAYKFRTMSTGAETRLDAVRGRNEQKGGFFKAKHDPRVTRVGRWLRRYSIDEFPQFINVLLGDMSIVGPRPLAVATGEMAELVCEFGPTAKKRTNTLPGITGLWQVSGRSDISAEQRFALDMFYIERWSLGLDLEIILKTVPAMLSGKGAY